MTHFTASEVARLVRAFDHSGIHRASTPGDEASGEWLAAQTRLTGATVTRMAVRLERTVIDDAYLLCANERIDGLPMYDSPATAADGISAALVPCGQGDGIGLLEMPPSAASIKGQALEQLRRSVPHRALVIATRVTGESLAPINAQYFNDPFGAPVLQVAGLHREWLAERAAQGAPATVVSLHHREPAMSYNLVAQVSGDATAAPLAMVTPRTGWWESVAERAGGIVAWMAGVAAAASLAQSGRPVRELHAFATCGHELGHVGLNELFAQRAPLIRDASCWLHLGANLGCASNPALALRASDEAWSHDMRARLIDAGYPSAEIRIEPIALVSGEGHDIVHHGGRVLSLAGANQHFHAASDRWPGNISTARISAIAQAVASWVRDRGGC